MKRLGDRLEREGEMQADSVFLGREGMGCVGCNRDHDHHHRDHSRLRRVLLTGCDESFGGS